MRSDLPTGGMFVQRIIRTERYERELLGWIFTLLFIAFNLFMIAVVGKVLWDLGEEIPHSADGLGMSLYPLIILLLWAFGSVILGVLSYMIRGRKVIIEERVEPKS